MAALGEVSGVDVDGHGHVFVFHRARRGWDTVTRSPIPEAAVLMLDPSTGALLASWGASRFRLPHGLTVDHDNHVWVTDAALHQVFQFSHDGALLRSWGEPHVAGWDAEHFNRPTDVWVRPDGGFYVSDGYENRRIAQFAANGGFVREWGAQTFALPHMITGRSHQLIVSDRENLRAVEYDTAGIRLGEFAPVAGSQLYSTDLDERGSVWVAVRNAAGRGQVGVMDPQRRIVTRFLPDDLPQVHDIALGPAGTIYVAETRPGGLASYAPRPCRG